MSKAFIILLILFLHIIADFNLQGWMATGKTQKYWKENYHDKFYRYDYICVLIMHSFTWTFMIMLPIAFIKGFNLDILFILVFIFNIIMHIWIDDQKANKGLINLWTDQLCHIVQLICTIIIFLFI